jgi:hypothetical protein
MKNTTKIMIAIFSVLFLALFRNTRLERRKLSAT